MTTLTSDKTSAWCEQRLERLNVQNRDLKRKIREIEKRLNRGRDVSLLFDQNVKRSHAVFANLFGIPAATTKTVALAALRTSAPVMLLTSAEVSPKKFKEHCFVC